VVQVGVVVVLAVVGMIPMDPTMVIFFRIVAKATAATTRLVKTVVSRRLRHFVRMAAMEFRRRCQ
jgi:hypothetical protein